MMTDPIADLITRIRNAARVRMTTTTIPWSKLKENIVRVLQREGYLGDVTLEEGKGGRKEIRVAIRYDERRVPIMTDVQRVSRPSLRVYVKADEIPSVRRGLGVSILSTPKGVLSDQQARKEHVGGEILCSVW